MINAKDFLKKTGNKKNKFTILQGDKIYKPNGAYLGEVISVYTIKYNFYINCFCDIKREYHFESTSYLIGEIKKKLLQGKRKIKRGEQYLEIN